MVTSTAWQSARRIVCVRLDSLGDVLMSSPAIVALASRGARVSVLTSPSGEEAARHIPCVDQVIVHEAAWMKGGAPSSSDTQRLIDSLRANAFDAALVMTVFTQSPLPAATACYLADIPLRAAFCRENPYHLLTDWIQDEETLANASHEVERQLALVRGLGFEVRDDRLRFSAPAAAHDFIDQFLEDACIDRPFVIVHPGASAMSRRYAPAKFAEVTNALVHDLGYSVVVTGASHERDIAKIVRGSAPCVFDASGLLAVEQLAVLIGRASLLVSNNTGPVHLAAAMGTPVVDIYALTNPQHTPWRVPSRVLFNDVPCRNCLKSVCPLGHNLCIQSVKPKEIVVACAELLEEASTPTQSFAERSYVYTGNKCGIS